MAKFEFPVNDEDFKKPATEWKDDNCNALIAIKAEGVALRNSQDPSKATVFLSHEGFKALMQMFGE